VPTYEYQCNECNVNYDLRQSFSASTTHVCEKCNKGTAKRILHPPTVVFKGSGFYVTDSKNKSKSDSSTKSTSLPNNSDAKSTTSNSDNKSSSSDSSS
jgi:putative FmdB family regulatory protein|tara:strand:+ start:508 stop:801 length:294 start_codon:yes stop_codon:yes gene_type:complete